QARERDLHPQRREHLAHARHQLLEMRVVAGGEREQTDLVVAGCVVTLQGGLNDRFNGAVPEWPLDDATLAEPALPGAAVDDLDGNPVVGCLDEWDDRPSR